YLVMQTIEKVMNASFFFPNDGNTLSTLLCASIILTIIVLGVSLPINVYVLWLFITGLRNEVRSEFFSFNLSLCQILVCFSALLGLLNFILYKNYVNSTLYIFNFFFFILHCISRPFFQGCICVERFVAVNHPIIFLKYKPLRYRTALSLVAWIIFLGFSVLCSFLPIRNTLSYIVLPEYILLFSIKILCSIAVLKALRKPRPGEKLNKKDAESNRMKKKAFR
ncbi:uracil nucleotide/cysteinyl leukotriene receptor-like, partial [Clarias magur]